MFDVKLLVPIFIGFGSLLYPLAIGSSITLSKAKLNLKIVKLENEQKELKTLLLKIQGTVMETQMQMMQIRNSGKPTMSTNLNEEVIMETMDGDTVNDEIGKKKGKKNN